MTAGAARAEGLLGAVVRQALRRPVAVTMGVVALLVLGTIAYARIPLQLLPSGYTPPLLYLSVAWPNATPAEGVQQVLEPLEAAVATVPGVRGIEGTSQTGSLGMRVDFSDSTDMDDAYNAVRDRIDRVRSSLPSGVRDVYVMKFDPEDEPVVVASVSAPIGVTDVYERIEARLVRRLSRLPGVGTVENWSGAPRVVEVALDRGRLRAVGLTPAGVAEVLRRASFVVAVGKVRDGERVVPVRVSHPMKELEALRDLPLGPALRLRDVGSVELVPDRTRGSRTRIDGREALILGVYKESRANTVATCRAVRELLEASLVEDQALHGATFEILFDQGDLIHESISNLETALLVGSCIAVVLMFLFLRRVRLTAVAALAIPASLLATIATLYLLGRSLNLLSLVGLMLSVGMVIDNAIVVVERIARRSQEGLAPRRAAAQGADEVVLAIAVATGTTLAAFVPVVLMSGDRGLRFFLEELALPVGLALGFSLIVAIVVVPLLSQLGAAGDRTARAPSAPGRTPRAYLWLLRRAISSPFDAVLVGVALFASALLLDVQTTDRLDAGADQVFLIFKMPPSFAEDERSQILRRVEQTMLERAEELGFTHVIVRQNRDRSRDFVRAYLKPPGERPLERDAIARRLKELVDPGPGVRWRVGWGGAQANSGKTLRLEVHGVDSDVLRDISAELVDRLEVLEGVISVESQAETSAVRELQARLRPEAALRHGVTPAEVGGSLALAVRGWSVGRMRLGERDADIMVRVAGADEEGRAAISQLELPREVLEDDPLRSPSARREESSLTGRPSLSAVVGLSEAPGLGAINRSEREAVVGIGLTLDEEVSEELRGRIEAQLADLPLPRGYRLGFGDRFARLKELEGERRFAVLLAMTFVFLLMGILFESWLLPLAVLVSLPFAFTGATWALAATGTARDVMSMVGMVILIGIVVNNAIVLVDAINRLRRDGQPRDAAVLQAGQERLRPILMTALTTVGGLLPLAVGAAQVAGVSYAPLARTVVGGLVTSTAVTLVLVPTAYVLLDDLAQLLGRAIDRVRSGSPRVRG